MHLGVFSFNVDYGVRIDELACAMEERGFESLWVPEHSHIPACRRTAYPGGGELPAPYYRTLDPLVSLMAVATATRRLKIGTAVCLVPQRDPIILAKQAATLDLLSQGRLLLGVGAGWNAEEMENHGVSFETRFQVLEENIRAIKSIWTEDKASHQSRFVNFHDIISFPKPVQKPHPPILMGGATASARARAVRLADAWFPIAGLTVDLVGGIADLARRAEAAGRDPASISVSVCAFEATDPDAIRGYRELGVERAVLMCPRKLDDALRFLDRFAELLP